MAGEGLSPSDPSSFSRPDLALVTNVFLALDINFGRKVLSGNVDLTVKKVDENVNEVILDANGLIIEAIYETETNEKLNFTLSEPIKEFGSKLTVELPRKDSNNYIVSVRYETDLHASGLQWLTPEQTTGKKHPFLFSQFQPIHARSVLPCQDTPGVKTTYSAVISAPKDITVLMSAICEHKKPLLDRMLFHFKQDVPVPSYLIAIAAGALESKEIGPRSNVWAEKEIIDAAKYEFSETEKQLKIAEQICGPYVWGRYDLLVLPPSFPFGGMENPCLTFVTPTVLTGDRSLADVVAHEIAHSWTGNLVTISNFEHFWLNEGFTVFIERKILGRLKSKEFQDFHALGGLSTLRETVTRLGKDNPLTQLVVDLTNVNPDDAFSEVPYEKGYIFLRYLENIVGGPDVFEPFLRKYFDKYKNKSLRTDDFKKFFEAYFVSDASIKDVDWQIWLYQPGMPTVIPNYDMTLHKKCKELKQRFMAWDIGAEAPFTIEEISSIIPEQVIQLLRDIKEEEPQPIDKLKVLEKLFKLNEVNNSEIKFLWLRIGLKAKWEEKIDEALKWVVEVGRMKFVRPLYRDLYNWEFARPRAIKVFQSNREHMMHVTVYTVAQDLRLIQQ